MDPFPQKPVVKVAGTLVRCYMCKHEFRIRNKRQMRCPDCGAVELWNPIPEVK